MTRMPPHIAAIMRASAAGSSSGASVTEGRSGPSPKFVTTASTPTREAMPTPFQRPSPWWASW